ncbi:hypothetical protein E2C01_059974 [Portunus trituberculatus]|uniref:Uncharacterized protein n=1 Tax=Portunus trituberculatus TaxID=210409 RepID=A0A5B7HA40_PORTR|nr:hypothetical protein [Portunus trituberculatus]
MRLFPKPGTSTQQHHHHQQEQQQRGMSSQEAVNWQVGTHAGLRCNSDKAHNTSGAGDETT